MQTTSQIAARLVPLPQDQREKLLQRFPKDRDHVSQLADAFEGSWYVHVGDLTIDSDFSSNLNLVVDGDLTIRGTLSDAEGEASLVVTGDVRAVNVLSSKLLVIMGSLHCGGLVHADYNDYSFEVWGPGLQARALVLTDKSALLPDIRDVGFEYNSDSLETTGRAEDFFPENLLRWQDEDFIDYKRVTEKEGVKWFADDGTPLSAAEARKLKIQRVVPALFEEMAAASHESRPLFKEPTREPLDWRLDRLASAEVVSRHAGSAEVKTRIAAAGHPQLPAERVKQLAGDPDPAVRMAIVHHPALESAAARVLAADSDAGVRRQLAASIHAAPHLDALVADASPDVRRACASHPALTDAHRRKLLADESKAVRARALRYLPVTEAWVKELRNASDEALVAWSIDHADEAAASSGAAPASASGKGDWQKDLLDPRAAVREAALRSAPVAILRPFLEEHRDRFVRDESANVRAALAMATRNASILQALSTDADRYVRRFSLDNLSAPAALLIAEATRLSKAPGSSWNMSDPGYPDHMTDLQELLKHPRLPVEALGIIHRVYPGSWRLEPHRNMPLNVILERAMHDSPSLEFDADFAAWRRVSQDPKAEQGTVFAALLKSESSDLQSAARMNGSTPAAALLAHAKSVKDDSYALEDIAQSSVLGATTPLAEELFEFLTQLQNSGIDSKLTQNPDLPLRLLKQIASRDPEHAAITLWQVHGAIMDAPHP